MIILKAEVTKTLPYLLELFNIKESGVDPSIKTPELINEQITQSLLQVVISQSEITPLVLMVEDLHWIDGSSENLLMKLLEIVGGSRVLIIYTYRPEYKKNWPSKTYLNQINLNRFSNRESTVMVANLTPKSWQRLFQAISDILLPTCLLKPMGHQKLLI